MADGAAGADAGRGAHGHPDGPHPLRTGDFAYELPVAAIAQRPLAERSQARMLVLHRDAGSLTHGRVAELPRWLRRGDLLVLNDTRVIPARLAGRRATGGRVEVLLLRPAAAGGAREARWRALVRPAGRLKAGEAIALVAPPPRGDAATGPIGRGAPPARPPCQPLAAGMPAADPAADALDVLALLGEGEAEVVLRGPLYAAGGAAAVMARYGAVPLPPYIHEPLADPERYQTVYARAEGSVAAPTAGLHLTAELLDRLSDAGIARAMLTLHVGVGTFRPVSVDLPAHHRMHAEWLEVPEACRDAIAATRARGGRVVAVGTTVVRALEARADGEGGVRAGSGWTDLFILPGWRFRVVDALLTNFHLPRSTLLMLVSAFAGRQAVLRAYREAVEQGYRFFSFGDAMLVI